MMRYLGFVFFFVPLVSFGQWNPNGDNSSTGSLTIGSSVSGSYSYFTIQGPNTPVGIGSKREIYFDFASAGDAVIRSYRGTSWDTHLQFLTTPASGGSPVTRVHMDGSGFVGIGTTSPYHKLEITDNGGTPSLGLRGAFDSKIVFETSDGADRFSIWSDMDQNTSNDLSRFGANNFPDVLTLKGDGYVGVGTTWPNAKLEIRGPSIRLSDEDTRYLLISQDAQGTPYGRAWSNGYAGGRQFKLSGWSHLPDNTGSVLKDIVHFDGYNLLLLKDNGGGIGIGTSKPDALLNSKWNYPHKRSESRP